MDVRMMQTIGPGTCVVDRGCGSGRAFNNLAGAFEQRIGLDLPRRRLEEAKVSRAEGCEVREADLNGQLPLADPSADAVTADQAVVYIFGPLKFSQEAHRILRSGGRDVVTASNIRYLRNIAHQVFSGFGPRTVGRSTMDDAWDDGHIHCSTHRNLRESFGQAGFSLVGSTALINLSQRGRVRHLLGRWVASWSVREILSGNNLIWAEK